MKKRTLFLGIIIASAGLTALGLVNKEHNNGCTIAHLEKNETVNFTINQDSILKSKAVFFDVHKAQNMAVAKEKLVNAKHLGDFIHGYPVNWIKDYESVEITATNNGIEKTIIGTSPNLSSQQKKLLKNSDWATSVTVKVKYNRENEIKKETENRVMHISMCIVPEEEAFFEGGKDKLLSYFDRKSNGEIDITKVDSIEIQQQSLVTIPGFVTVVFKINEEGKAEGVKLIISSNVEETDKLILSLIREMPNWKPGKDIKGNKVKQEFELTVGGPFVGC